MELPETSGQYVFITVSGPKGTDLTQYPVQIAIVLETDGEPETGQYTAADWTWSDPPTGRAKAALLVPAGTYPAGMYMAWVQVTAAGGEAPVIQSGRIRIGDGGS